MTMIQVSNHSKKRALVPTKFQKVLNDRIRETVGIIFIFFGFLIFLALFTYDSNDPSIRNATGLEPENFLGFMGSYTSDILLVSLGIGSYCLPFIFVSWGYRIVVKGGLSVLLRRSLFLPITLIVTPLFFATNEAPASWIFSNGLGGVTGDTYLEYLLKKQPLEINLWLKLISIISAFAFIFSVAFSSGVTISETKKLLKKFFLHIFQIMKFLGFDILAFIFNKRPQNQKKQNFHSAQKEGGVFEGLLKKILFKSNRKLFKRNAVSENYEDSFANNENPNTTPSQTINSSSVTARSKVFFPHQKKSPVSLKAKMDFQPTLGLEKPQSEFELPSLTLLEEKVEITNHNLSEDSLQENARMLESVLDDYGVKGQIITVRPGPVVTLYELEPAPGIKASRVVSLSDDIARSMSALAARVSTIPGRSVIGIELPNAQREKVLLREILASKAYGDSKFHLPLALGRDIGGEPIIANLSRMPHLLIAGTTGSGKSVGINTMILSLLYSLNPDECRMIMIDPKMLELSVYDGIPHLLSPVVTDPKKAVVALKWAVLEMEDRYKKMSKLGVRNIETYNSKVNDATLRGENFSKTVQIGFDEVTGEPKFEEQFFEPKKLPFIVVIVDEMADLMMVAGKEIEACIQRLAQMARAAGIHLIMATQRPSVDVITGTIKANFPTRISFQVTSKIDSRTILGEMGGEQLLGMGDMLFMANGGKITRVHGPFVSDREVESVVMHIKNQRDANYEEAVLAGPDPDTEDKLNKSMGLLAIDESEESNLYDRAVSIVARDRKCSTSYIQRKLSIGYNRAAKIVEEMEANNVVSGANHVGKREIFIQTQEQA